METEGDVVTFGGSYGKEPQDYKDIVLRAVEKCRVELSKEMTKGGEVKVMLNNNPMTITKPDQRKIAIETIVTLKNYMNRVFDDVMRKKYAELTNNIIIEYKKYYDRYLLMENDPRTRRLAETTKVIHKTKIGSEVLHEYEDYKLSVYREILEELLLLLQRKNDLSKKRIVVD